MDGLLEPEPAKKRPLGMDKGKLVIHDDFDDPIPEWEEAFEGVSGDDHYFRPPDEAPEAGQGRVAGKPLTPNLSANPARG